MRIRDFRWVGRQPQEAPSACRGRPPTGAGFWGAAALAALGVVGGFVVAGSAVPAVSSVAVAVHSAHAEWDRLPAEPPDPPLPGRTVIVDRNGRVVAQVFSINRIPVPAERQSELVRKAAVATEDASFYSHSGVDVRGLVRAGLATAGGGRTQGGSTITQQYVKNLRITEAVNAGGGNPHPADVAEATKMSIGRKAEEARMALALERKQSKDEILTGYLNVSYFGQGAFGVQAAAQRYFSRDAADLSLDQAALLAGLLQAPGRTDPIANPAAALRRRSEVLSRMLETGAVTAADAAAADAAPIGVNPSSPRQGCQAAKTEWAFACDAAIRELRAANWLGPDARALLGAGGLTIKLTVDPRTQAAATREAARVIPANHRVANSIVMVEPGTGKVLAIGSNRRFGIGRGRTEVPLATRPRFSPGSTFKLFTLLAALEQGIPLSTRLPGGDVHYSDAFDNPQGGYRNAEGLSGSDVTIPQATERSLNTAYVQLEERVGVAAVASAARRLGIRSIPGPGKNGAPGKREGSFTLGMRDVSVMDMAGAYAAVSAHGRWCPPHVVGSVTLPDGRTLEHPVSDCRQVVAAAVADTAASVLAGVIASGTGRDAALPGRRPAAGKTGTAEGAGAAWFAGFTPQAAAAVWTGDPRSPRFALHDVLGLATVYGGTLPADLWRQVMATYHNGKPVLPLPAVDPAYLLAIGAPDPDASTVPDAVGQAVEAAEARLRSAGFDVITEVVGERSGIRPRTVVSQAPRAGAVVRNGSQVRLGVTQ